METPKATLPVSLIHLACNRWDMFVIGRTCVSMSCYETTNRVVSVGASLSGLRFFAGWLKKFH